MSRFAAAPVILAGLLLAGTACDVTSPHAGAPVAIVAFNTRLVGSSYVTIPVVNFYRTNSPVFQSANSASDTCQAGPYAAATTTPSTAPAITGGDYVAITLSGASDSLHVTSSTDLTYRLASSIGFFFTPGDSATISIAGIASGYPPASMRARTAEPFTLGPVVLPAAGQPLTLTWTTATDGNAAMLISFRYDSTGTSTVPNKQIFCDFKDHGSGTIPAALIGPYTTATGRVMAAQRLRTRVVVTDPATNATMDVVSTFDVPTLSAFP